MRVKQCILSARVVTGAATLQPMPIPIHMIYIPWGKDQKLLADLDAFDHQPCENMRQYAAGFEVKLWTHSRIQELCLQHYPSIWRTISTVARPMVMVDLLRWLVVYHFGGIYWQYDMNPLVPMDRILPSPGKKARVFTEFVLGPEECLKAAAEPIRQGEPEEPLRIVNQAFSAEPGHPFIKATRDLILERIQRYELKTDYDLLFISANAAVSTAYDRFGKGDPTVELVSRPETREIMKIDYKGTWRTDRKPDRPEAARPAAVSPLSKVAALCKKTIKSVPLAVGAYHRFVQPHPHETAFEKMAIPSEWPETLVEAMPGLVADFGIHSVLEFPCGDYSSRKAEALKGLRYIGGGPVRKAIDRTRRQGRREGVSFRLMNIMYSCFPPVDLVVCRDFLVYLDYREIFEALRNLARSRSTYLLTTTYPLLNSNWDSALGDWRPLSFTLPPFSFPPPVLILPDRDEQRRPDRSLGLWKIADLTISPYVNGQQKW
ncbi:MAG: hypothetical protein KKC51_10705 [Verrucomicrobia bacterium]|nr:hypothetical protein [Verrucomicrobiota bacterium]